MRRKWIDNKNIVLTGVTSGLGRLLAKYLIEKHNCFVFGVGRRQEAIDQFKEELRDKANLFDYKLFDVSKEQNWKDLSKEFENKKFQVDILINNAGQLPKFKKFSDSNPEEIENIMKVNFMSSVYSIHHLFSNLEKSTCPSIINVSSSASLCPLAGTSAYTASKSALKTFTECLIEDFRKKIYVAYVCPGFTKTEIFRNQKVEIEKLVDMICSSCEKNTKRILKGILKRKKRIVVGFDAKLMDSFYRAFPKTFSHTCSSILKKSKIKLFSQVFEEKIEK